MRISELPKIPNSDKWPNQNEDLQPEPVVVFSNDKKFRKEDTKDTKEQTKILDDYVKATKVKLKANKIDKSLRKPFIALMDNIKRSKLPYDRRVELLKELANMPIEDITSEKIDELRQAFETEKFVTQNEKKGLKQDEENLKNVKIFEIG